MREIQNLPVVGKIEIAQNRGQTLIICDQNF